LGLAIFIVTWQDYRSSITNADVYIQKILSNGTIDGSNFKISDNIWDGNQTKPRIASFSNGNRIVTWWEPRSGSADIHAQFYDDDANLLGENIKVNGTYYAAMPDVAAGGDSRALVVWSNYKKLNIQGQLISSDGNLSGPVIKIDTLDTGSGFVSVDYNNGTYIVTWHESQAPDYGNIFARRFDVNGIPLGPSFKVNDDMGTTTQDRPDIAINNQGDFLIVWQDSRNNWPKIYAQIFNSDGEKVNSNIRINHSPTDSLFLFYLPCAAATDSCQFVIAYRTFQQNVENNVSLRFFGSDGSYIGNSIGLNDEPIYDRYGSKNAVNPAITTGDSSRIVVTWEDEFEGDDYYYYDDLRGQRLISNTKVGSNFSISDDDGSDQNNSAVDLWGKEIFITWEDNRYEILASDIMANVLDFGNPEITSVSKLSRQPMVFNLSQNYPNPFNPTTAISYKLWANSIVDLSIYNILGQQVATLVSKKQPAGTYKVEWNASGFASGVYIYQLKANSQKQKTVFIKKMVLLK